MSKPIFNKIFYGFMKAGVIDSHPGLLIKNRTEESLSRCSRLVFLYERNKNFNKAAEMVALLKRGRDGRWQQ